jgi:hypothetical protein
MFPCRLCSTLKLDRLAEVVKRISDEKLLTGAVFLNIAKSFHSSLVKGLLCKLTISNLPSCLLGTISSHRRSRIFQTSFYLSISAFRSLRYGVVQGGLVFSVTFGLYVHDMPTPSRHVELALCADDTNPKSVGCIFIFFITCVLGIQLFQNFFIIRCLPHK